MHILISLPAENDGAFLSLLLVMLLHKHQKRCCGDCRSLACASQAHFQLLPCTQHITHRVYTDLIRQRLSVQLCSPGGLIAWY